MASPGSSPPPTVQSDTAPDPDRHRTIMLVHGRNTKAREALTVFMEALGLRVLDFDDMIKGSKAATPFVLQAVQSGFDQASAAVVLLTGDDIAYLHPDLVGPEDLPSEKTGAPQPRPNVLIELGMALARFKQEGTLICALGTLRPATDISGLHFARLADDDASRESLAGRLKLVCPAADTSRPTKWMKAGKFSDALLREMTATPISHSHPAVSHSEFLLLWHLGVMKAEHRVDRVSAMELSTSTKLDALATQATLDRLRKKGLVTYYIVGSNTVWGLTADGRMLAVDLKPSGQRPAEEAWNEYSSP